MAPQQHLDSLSAVDASFLLQEGDATHMHIGALATFEGPPPSYEAFIAHIRSRLHLVPRYRQKIAELPLGVGRPVWVDDPNFNLEYHVRNSALPTPGGEEELRRLTSRIFSQRLDRTKPLWEMWLVQGLEDNRFALITKTHHCLVDGIAGLDLMTTLFDTGPVPREAGDDDGWLPRPEPSQADLLASGVKGLVETGLEIAGGLAGAVTRPQATLGKLRERLEGIGEVAWAGLNPPPPTPLTTEIGPHRRFEVVRERLTDLKEIKNVFGGTVNDVVLAVVAGALAKFMLSRGIRTEGLELRACVPVSVRPGDDHTSGGNQLTQILCPLPVYIDDPLARLENVKETMGGLKDSKQAMGATTIASMEDFAPPTILAQASRLHFASRMYTLLVTNIPGPQIPLYVLGRELQEVVPVAFLGGNRSLAIAIMSYNGGVYIGLIGDYDALPDLDIIAAGLSESIAELLLLARLEGGRRLEAEVTQGPRPRAPR